MSRTASSFKPYVLKKFSENEMIQRTHDFYKFADKRRSVRSFSGKSFPIEILENAIKSASTAPSGANKQPWTFAIISNADLKHQIRELAEKEEYSNYHGRMSNEWLEELKLFGTNHIKEFIDVAPYIVVVFKQVYDLAADGTRTANYYVNESVGIAVGMFIAAIHHAGLACLTHTPSPMNFLEQALNRPQNERAFLLIPVGYPSDEATVPDITRKSIDEILVKFP